MRHNKGFTLIELLVVIAIITILAATVAPRVSNWISRGRMARATAEIRNAELAITKMLADVDRKSVAQFFVRNANAPSSVPLTFAASMQSAMMTQALNIYNIYSNMFYELLRRGKNAEVSDLLPYWDLDSKVRSKLGTSYMEIGNDPWGNKYIFYPGPLNSLGLVGFRSYRINDASPDQPYIYNLQKEIEDGKLRGNPKKDFYYDNSGALVYVPLQGYPAPRDLPVYIYSYGEDLTQGQYIDILSQIVLNHIVSADGTYSYNGGGDDINNWDSSSGWSSLY